jgi:ATP-binding cassette, subfamily B, bacterial
VVDAVATADSSVRRRLGTVVNLAWSAYPIGVVSIVMSALLLGLFPVATAWLTKLLIDHLAAGSGNPGLAVITALISALGAVAVGTQLVPVGVQYVRAQLTRAVEVLAKARLFRKLNSFDGLAPFEQPRFYDRIHLAREAGTTAPQQLTNVAGEVIQYTVTLVGFLSTLLVVNPLVALIVLIAAIPHLIAEVRLSKARTSLRASLTPAERRQFFYSALQSEPAGAKELRLFGLGDFFLGRMLTELRKIQLGERALDRRTLRTQALLGIITAVIGALALAVVVLDVTSGRRSVGDITVLLAGFAGMTSSTAGLVRSAAKANEAFLSISYYQTLMDTPSYNGVAATRTATPLRNAIELRDVWFQYGERLPWILRGVTLRIPYGESVALVGLNGSGKSTIVKLLCRLYDPDNGYILWDGVDIRELDCASLRQRIGSVFQDHMTYDLTVAENIGLGDLARLNDLSRIQQAAASAGIHPAIIGLPRGYNTMLSRVHFVDGEEDDGVLLSSGQWQRLALARMLLRDDRDFLILDEPSSGLDPEAEYAVHQAVKQHTGVTSQLLISHRLNAVRDADSIAVLDGGRIIEQGTHRQLMNRGARYAELFTLQASGYQADTDHASRSGR